MKKRKCECCGGNDQEFIYSDKKYIKTRNETYLFWQHVVICHECGFCFNSPCPTKEDLENYYADCFSINEVPPFHYSIDARINALKNYISEKGKFVEIGGNQAGEFHKRLLKHVGSIQNVDLNNSCLSNLKTVDALSGDSIDVVACYDVLEHIPKIKEFLQSCRRVLKDAGIMMIEVPDIKFYPHNLMLFCSEHVNHFSVYTLEKIFNDSGFKLVETRHATSSRPLTGFLAIFRKEDNRLESNNFDRNYAEYLDNRACLKEGVEQIEKLERRLSRLRERIAELNKENKKVTLWCVTDFLYKMIDNFDLSKNIIIVDSDIRKKDYLKDKKIPVLQPINCLEHIKESDLLVILSPRNKNDILAWIKNKIGYSFNEKKVVVIGDGLYG